MRWIVYKTTNLIIGRYYIGVHKQEQGFEEFLKNNPEYRAGRCPRIFKTKLTKIKRI